MAARPPERPSRTVLVPAVPAGGDALAYFKLAGAEARGCFRIGPAPPGAVKRP